MNELEHRLALIHAEIDGELTGPQRAQLNRLLLAEPELRALRDGLRRTCDAIDALPAAEPPADLRESILQTLPATERGMTRRRPWARWPAMRYAASFAAGLVVSALAFQSGVLPENGIDSRNLAGTIASVPADPSRLELRLDGVRGTIRLAGSSQAPVVHASLTASQPVEVVARLDGQEVRLTGFTAPHNEPVQLRAGFSHRDATGPARISISVRDSGSGAVLRTATLQPNARTEK